jgi:cardiolipin synthase
MSDKFNFIGVLNIPNTLTLARIIIIPIFITTIVYRRYDLSLFLFISAALTDLLDGLIARLKNQRTMIGTFLDPLADKFLLVSSFVVLSIYDFIPKWITIVVISRDVIVVVGWFLLYIIFGLLKVEPSILGKITIWVQSFFIIHILLNINVNFVPDLNKILIYLTSVVTIGSGLEYIFKGLKVTHEK